MIMVTRNSVLILNTNMEQRKFIGPHAGAVHTYAEGIVITEGWDSDVYDEYVLYESPKGFGLAEKPMGYFVEELLKLDIARS